MCLRSFGFKPVSNPLLPLSLLHLLLLFYNSSPGRHFAAMQPSQTPSWLYAGAGQFERSSTEGHHRWGQPKAMKCEARWGGWDLTKGDLLEEFLQTLPVPLGTVRETVLNKHGEEAQLVKLLYANPTAGKAHTLTT